MNQSYNRRRFLQITSTATAALGVATFVPSTAFGANEKIHTGHIGVGRQGSGNLNRFKSQAIAVCDVDQNHLDKAASTLEKAGKKPIAEKDYRKLLERDDIDAVVISTPDHWHALPVIHACEAGKDAYCEKPLTLTIEEGRLMVKAARKNERIVQTGSQQRSSSNFRIGCELVRSGRIGKLQEVRVGIADPNHPGKLGPNTAPPAHLDYDFWLGPAKEVEYNEKRVHYNFRFWWDYSGGQMTNWGAHHIDIAHWGMGMDNSGPLLVEGEATFHPDGYHEVTQTIRLKYTYPQGVSMLVGQGQKDIRGGTTFIGEKGTIYVNRGQLSSTPGDIINEPLTDDDVHLYESKNHVDNFLDCIKSRELPVCDVEIGHRSATACHLGNIVARTGETVRWDAVRERVVSGGKAADLVSRENRTPWKLG